MLEETGIDISENVIIDRFNYCFANKSSNKKWFLYAIDLTNLNLDINKTYYGKGDDGTEFEKGIHAKFVNSFTLSSASDTLSTSIWGKWDLIRRYKENEKEIFFKNVTNSKKQKINFNKKIDLRKLFNKENFDNENWFGFSLHYAVDNGYFEIAKWLLENGADINIEDENGCTPLHYAIIANADINLINLLIEKGTNINAQVSLQNEAKKWLNKQYNLENLELLAKIAKPKKENKIKKKINEINNFENKNYKKHKPNPPKISII